MSSAGVLAHYESANARPTTFIPLEVAEQLARRMAAERISRRLFRMLPPNSVFLPAKDFPQTRSHQTPEQPLDLDRAELPGVRCLFSPEIFARWRAKRFDAIVGMLEDYCWSE